MTRLTVWVVLTGLVLVGCSDAGEANKKLDNLDERMTALEGKIGTIEQWVGKMQKEADSKKDDDNPLGGYSLGYQLDKIEKRLAGIQDKLDRPALPTRPTTAVRPPGPDPDEVYAVPIDGAPYEGPKHAKVTIVKAYEYA